MKLLFQHYITRHCFQILEKQQLRYKKTNNYSKQNYDINQKSNKQTS